MSRTEGFRAWGVSLCCVTGAIAVVQFLAPKNSTGKLLEMLCGAVLLFCMLSPLVKVDWRGVLSWEALSGETVPNEHLGERLIEQLNEPLQQAVNEAGQAALKPYGFEFDEIAAIVDIDAAGSIYIKEIAVTLNAQQAVRRVAIKQILEQRFMTDVTIREEYDAQATR